MTIWYISSGFGTMYQEKSGNPGLLSVSTNKCVNLWPAVVGQVVGGPRSNRRPVPTSEFSKQIFFGSVSRTLRADPSHHGISL
jgi:hypothetical protein